MFTEFLFRVAAKSNNTNTYQQMNEWIHLAYNRIYFSNRKETCVDTCGNMDSEF